MDTILSNGEPSFHGIDPTNPATSLVGACGAAIADA
jgi:hypothetical protein